MSQVGSCPCISARKSVSQKACGTRTATKPATVKPIRISSHTIFHSSTKEVPTMCQPIRLRMRSVQSKSSSISGASSSAFSRAASIQSAG